MIRRFIAAGLIGVAVLVASCDGSRGGTRGVFYGMVIGKTEEEVTSKFGKPESIEKVGSDGLRYVYRKKTFDPDNMSQVDDHTNVDFEGKDGKMIVIDVSCG
jgi:hypothetical protein